MRFLVTLGIWLLSFHILLAQDTAYAVNLDTSVCAANSSGSSPLLYGGALPASLVVENTVLLSQPPLMLDTKPLEIALIPANAWVIVFEKDAQTESYFRVIFPCQGYHLVGWVSASSVRHSLRRANATYAPFPCAHPSQVMTNLDDRWTSTVDGKIMAVVDVVRLSGGTPFPRSYFYLTKNNREIRDKERVFESSGVFLIRSLILDTEVRVGNPIGFSVITESDEELAFFATLYALLDDCPAFGFGPEWGFPNVSQQEFRVVDQRELLGEVFKEQTGIIDNSTENTSLQQDIALRREFRHSIDLQLNENSNLDRQKVEECILATYDLPDQIGNKNCTILADIPAGQIYSYEIEWTQVLREGNIEESEVPGQGNILGTYRIIIDIQCQRIGAHLIENNIH